MTKIFGQLSEGFKSLTSSNTASNSKTFGAKFRNLKTLVLSTVVTLLSGNAIADNDVKDHELLDTGVSVGSYVSDHLNTVGSLNDLGVKKITEIDAQKILLSGSVVTALQILDLDSSLSARAHYIDILSIDVDLSIDENGKIKNTDENFEANNALYRIIKKSIHQSLEEQVIAGQGFQIHSASTTSGSTGADFSYGNLKLSAQTGNSTSVRAGYQVNDELKLTGTTGENNNTAGVEYRLNNDTTIKLNGGDTNTGSINYKLDNNISLSGQTDDQNGAGVGMSYHNDDGTINANVLQSSNDTSINISHSGITIKEEPLVLNAGVTYNDSDLGYTFSAGQIFGEDFAYKLKHAKTGDESTILAKAVYGMNQNFYLQGLYAELKQTGLEYTYEEFSQPGFVKGLSFGDASQRYNAIQKTFGIGATYVNNANLVSIDYTYSKTPNQTFDKRISVTQEGNLLVTHDILAGVAGYKHHELVAAVEYQIVPSFALTGEIGYESTQLNKLYDLPEEEFDNLVWGAGGKYTSEYFSMLGKEIRTHVEVFYREQDSTTTSGIKAVFDIKDSWLQRHGLYPYVGFERNEYYNGVDQTQFTFGISADFGGKNRQKGISHIVNKHHQTNWNGPTDRFAQNIVHTGTYNTQAGELVQSETIENAHDYIIDLGAVSLTGEFISNVASVEQFIKIENNKLVLIGVNSGNFDTIAGQLFKLGLTQTNGEVLIVKLFNEQGSFNVTKVPGSVLGVSRETSIAFVRSNNVNYNGNQIEDIIDLLFLGDISVATAKNIFDGTINPSIVTTGLLTGNISPAVLNFISDNSGSIDQEKLIELLENGEKITSEDVTDNINQNTNTSPVAVDDIFIVSEDGSLDFSFTDLIGNDTDKQTPSDKLKIIKINGENISEGLLIDTQYGKIVLSADGGNYKPAANLFDIEDVFEYTIEDEGGKISVAKVTIKITAENDAPEIIIETINIDEEARVVIPKEDIVIDIDTPLEDLQFQVLVNGKIVEAKFTSEGLEITGLKNLAGNDSITIQVIDDNFEVEKEISVTIKNTNDAPVAVTYSKSVEISETGEKFINISELFSDVDIPYGDILTAEITGDLNNAEIVGTPGTESYKLKINGFDVNQNTNFTLSLIATDKAGAEVGNNVEVKVSLTIDTTPDAFTLTDPTNINLSTVTESNTIIVAGINTATVISVTDGEYSKNGGTYTSVAGTVSNTDTVKVRLTSSGSFSTTDTVTLDIGGVTENFDVTTLSADTTPNAFSFTDATNVSLNTQSRSGSITVSGLNTTTAISITGGEYELNNSGAWTSVSGTVSNTDTVKVRIISSVTPGVTTQSTLNIGGVVDTFDVTTVGPDTTPDAFTLTDPTNINLSTVTESNTIIVAGINTATVISVTDGEYSKNGGTYTSVAGTVSNTDTVKVRLTSSGSFSTTDTVTLDIGGVTENFDVTTLSADTTPNAFSFTDATNVSLNTQSTSDSITVSGLNTTSAISITGGEYELNNSGTWTSVSGTVSNTDTVKVRITSSVTPGVTTQSTLNIGGVVDTFDVTTVGPDTTPDAFTLTDPTNINLSTVTESNTIIVSGLNTSTTISVTGGEYELNNSGTWVTTAGTVVNTDTVKVRLTSSGSFSTTDTATLDIGGVTEDFDVTTLSADTTPNAFSFTDATNVSLNTQSISGSITVSGLNTTTAISITGGEYELNNSGTWTSVSGTVSNTDTVKVRITSSNSFNTLVQTTLDIGGITDIFDVTTLTNTAPTATDFTATSEGQSGTILKTEIDAGISDTQQSDSDLDTIVTAFDSAGVASAVVNASNNILWTAKDGFEGTTNISYRVNDGFLNSGIQTITLNADKKAPSISSQTIALTLQNTVFSGQTLIVNDLNDINQGNTSLAFITPGNVSSTPGGTITITSITKINATQSSITFSGSTPNVQFLQIKTTVEDEFGNILEDAIIPGLFNLSVPNSAPTLSQTTITLDVGGNYFGSFDLSTIYGDDNTAIGDIAVVPVVVDNSKFTYGLVGNIFTITRIDGNSSQSEEISVLFRDQGGLDSPVLTIKLEDFDNE